MIRKTLLAAALAATAALGAAGTAQARGGHGSLPCLTDKVIEVAAVPQATGVALASRWGLNTALIRPGHGVDLGYRFDHCTSKGRWVGYIGYSETDLELTDDQLRELAGAAGLSALPPAPGLWSNPNITEALFIFGVGALVLVFRLAVGPRRG